MENVPFDVQAKEIMSNFNFQKVHHIMRLLNWTWMNWETGIEEVPNLDGLRKQARNRLCEAWNRYCKTKEKQLDYIEISSGGLKATVHQGVLRLEFVLADWCADYLFDEMER